MNEIRRVLRLAAWRLAVTSYFRALIVAIAAVLSGAIVLRLVQQQWPLESELPWAQIAIWGGAGAALAALVWTIATRANSKAVARRVDEGAQLKESISTAMCVSGSDEPWARVVVESAVSKVRGVKLREAVPIQAPRFWPVPMALALSLLVVWLAVQRRTTVASIAKADQETKILQAKTEAKEATAKIEEMTKQLNLDTGIKEDEKADALVPEPRDPEAIRLEAIKKLSSVTDRLEQLKDGEKGQKNDSVQDAMRQLKQPGPGPMQEVAKELARGNFQKASEEMAKALEKIKSGEMSEKDMAKMAEQLKELAKQLEKIAQDSKELESDLEKAGLSKELAKDPEALKKALENAQNLTEQQKQDLLQQAQAKKESSDACKNLSQCMNNMAQNMSPEGMNPDGLSDAQELSEQLSELEMLAQEMQACEAALNECKSQMNTLASQCKSGQCEGMGESGGSGKNGDWKSGWSEKTGNGSGGPGRGNGTGRSEAKADFEATQEKFKTTMQGGPTIGSQLVDGEQVRGESRAELAAALERASEAADDAIENNRVPREYQDAVKRLYSNLKKKAEEKKATDTKPADADK